MSLIINHAQQYYLVVMLLTPAVFLLNELLFLLHTSFTIWLSQVADLMDFSMDRAPDILQTLHYLNLLVLSLKNPLGTKDHPARLCRDLITCQHKFNDGMCTCLFQCTFCITLGLFVILPEFLFIYRLWMMQNFKRFRIRNTLLIPEGKLGS